MVRSSTIADAVILTSRKDVQKVTADHLKMKGVSNVVSTEEPDVAIDAIDRFPKGLLVVDWELGAPKCCRVLAHNRRRYPPQTRPILLIAPQVTDQLVATAAEYAVTQVYTDQISPKSLGARLGGMIIGETIPSDIKKAFAEASELRGSGDHKGAFRVLQQLFQKHPSNLRVRCEVAECLMHLDQWDKAQKVLEGLDKAKPPYLRGMHLLGRCLMKLGKFEDAVTILEQANLFNPNDVERLVDIGNAMLQLDKSKEAEATFDKALAVDDGFRAARLGKGQCRLTEGHVNDALAILREVAGDLELASMFNTSAVLNMRRGRHDAGMNLYSSALKALGKDEKLQARLYFNMGIGYRRQQKKDMALQCFERAMKLDPKFAKAKAQVAVVNGTAAPKGKAFGKQPAADAGGAPQLVESQPAALPKAAGADFSMLVDFTVEAAVFDEDDLEESLYDD